MQERAIFIYQAAFKGQPDFGQQSFPAFEQACLTDMFTAAGHSSLYAEVYAPLPLNNYEQIYVDTGTAASANFSTGNFAEEGLVPVLERGFEAGFQMVCVTTGYSPHLPVAFYTEAFGRLERDAAADVVVVPTDRGGVLLVALPARQRTHLSAIFAGTNKGSNTLSLLSLNVSAAGLRLACLPTWYDLRQWNDLIRLRTDLRRGVAHAPATRKILETREQFK